MASSTLHEMNSPCTGSTCFSIMDVDSQENSLSKIAAQEKQLAPLARDAYRQIEKNEYTAEMKARKVDKVVKLGIAFCGKKVAFYEGNIEERE